jgi:hypothetical protein
MSSDKHGPLAPKLAVLQEHLESVREEICDVPHVSELNTGEMVRVEETLAIAADAAKEVVSVRRRMRRDADSGDKDRGQARG